MTRTSTARWSGAGSTCSATSLPAAEGERWSRLANEHLKALAEREPRLIPLATVPLQDGARAAEVLRAAHAAGFRGAMIGTQPKGVGGVLDDPALDPFWRAADELGAVLFIHPVFESGDARVHDYGMANAVGRITDTLIAVSRIIYSGHILRYRNAKIIVGIGGAALPYVIGRLRRNYEVDRDKLKDPDAGLAALYYDTLVHDVRALRLARRGRRYRPHHARVRCAVSDRRPGAAQDRRRRPDFRRRGHGIDLRRAGGEVVPAMTRDEARKHRAARGRLQSPKRGYRDLHEHLDALRERDLLLTIDRPIDKDAELHPLVRWQFVGGIEEAERKAFLFTNVDRRARPQVRHSRSWSARSPRNRAIYSVGMGAPVEEIQAKWDHAIANPVPPRVVDAARRARRSCSKATALQGEGNGLDSLPIPISTPGFDSAPTLTATNVITRDPETGMQNMGTYRAALKAPDRLVVRMATRVGGAGGYQHYLKHQQRGDKTMPCAIVLGCPPYVAFMGPQKLPIGVDEIGVAGGLAGAPINVVRARTVDLLVPAEAEIVIEGLIDTEYRRARRRRSANRTATSRSRNSTCRCGSRRSRIAATPIVAVLHQPGDAERIERDQARRLRADVPRASARHARHPRRQARHAARAADRRCCASRIVTVEKGTPRTEVWRALNGAAFFKGDCGKICIAVNEDIDPDNADALFWAMAYRMNPVEDIAGAAASRPGPRPRARARAARRTRRC